MGRDLPINYSDNAARPFKVRGRRFDWGRPLTRSDAAGWGCSYTSCMRRGWLGREGELTQAGAELLVRP